MKTTKKMLAGLFGGLMVPGMLLAADEAPKTITITGPIKVETASTAPAVSIKLGQRSAKVIPTRVGCAHSGGGNITVAQPTADKLVITLTGSVVASAGPFNDAVVALDYDVAQCIEVSFDDPEVKAAKLEMDAQVVGVLRADKKGSAEVGQGCINIGCATGAAASICTPPHSVSGCTSLSVNDYEGPVSVPVLAGKYTVNATWHVGANMPKGGICKGPSAEFAPDAVDPVWLHHKAAFYGIDKKPFGLILTVTASKVEQPKKDEPKAEEKKPEEKPAEKPAEAPAPAAPAAAPVPAPAAPIEKK